MQKRFFDEFVQASAFVLIRIMVLRYFVLTFCFARWRRGFTILMTDD